MSEVSPEVRSALSRFASATAEQVHRAQFGLARLLVEQGPPGSPHYLELAQAFLERRANASALREAKQDLWTYVGQLACGCSLADSASAHAMMTCLETSEDAHSPSALAEQVERALRCGVSEAAAVAALLEAVGERG
jgi:hypothetical protein